MNFLSFLPSGIIILNIIFIILLIFFERKDPTATWAWLLILTLIPVLGFILYLFFGLTPKKRKVYQRKQQNDELSNNRVKYFEKSIKEQKSGFDHLEQSIMRPGFQNELPAEIGYNKLKIYSNGKDKFEDLFNDLKNAKDFIHA